ncbi:MAG: glycosyltransferase [Polyangiaceae bacterium]|nr:glycosyltransferase [Polyangiaceae bacterium]
MRVVVITTSFPRSDDDPSGHFVRSSAEALVRAGDEVHVVAPGGSPLDPPSRRGALTVHRAGGGALFAWPGAAARAREAPWRLLAAPPFAAGAALRLRALAPFDRAVAHWIVPCAFPLLLAASPRAAVEVRAHGADVRLLLGAPRAARAAIVAWLLRRRAHFVFAARAQLDALAAALPPALAAALASAARVEPPAIDLPDVADRARALRRALDLAPGERLAVAACRLIPTKRVDLAILAARAASPPVRLVIVGDGPERPALERLASPAAVLFTGALPRREALAWIAAADALIHPSAVEAAPTAIREARALGVPVVACAAGDVAAWALADPGIAIAAPTEEALAAALASLAPRGGSRPLAPPG